MTTLFDDPNYGMYEAHGGILQSPGQDPPGIGLPAAPPPAPPAGTQDLRRDAIAKMGTGQKILSALGEFGAGVTGRPSPLNAQIQQQSQERLQKLQEFKVHTDALEDGVKMASKLKGDARKNFVKEYSTQLETAMPGLGKAYESLSDTPDMGTVLAKYASKSPTLARTLELDPSGEAAIKMLSSPEAMKTINAEIDSAVMPILSKKGLTFLKGWQRLVPKDMSEKLMKDGRITAAELLEANDYIRSNNPDLAKTLALSDEDLQIIGRNEDAFYGGIGIVPPKKESEITAKQAEKNSPLGQLMTERDQLPADSKDRKAYDDAISKTSTPNEHDTMNERAMERLRKLQLKVDADQKYKLSHEEQLQAEQDHALLAQQRMMIDPVTNKPMFVQPITVPPSITVGRGKGEGKVVNDVPPTTGGRKGLDSGTEKELAALGDLKSTQQSAADTFKKDYVGFVVPGSGQLAFEAGRRGVDKYKDMAVWWQNYANWTNQVRHTLYGSALTKQEVDAFEKSIVTHSDDFDVAKANFERQKQIVDGAVQRRLNAIEESGQNSKQAKALVNVPAKDEEIKAKPLNTWADKEYDYRELPDGSIQRRKKK